jgi:hypothetical protein
MYGQPGMPMGNPMMMGQPMMGAGMMGQPMMGQPMMGGGMMAPAPIYKQISVGMGIDMVEFNKIVQCATSVYQSRVSPLSTHTANSIKAMLGGEWLVVCYPATKQYDFSLSTVKAGDFMAFSLDNTLFQVCRMH